MTDEPFRRRTVVLLAVVASASLLVTVAVTLFVDDVEPKRDAAATTASRAALGHSVLIDVLEAADVPVVVSTGATADRAGDDSLVLMLEPDVGADADVERLRDVLRHRGPLLVALPKWRGRFDEERPHWLADVVPRPREEAETVLAELSVGGEVARPAAAVGSVRSGTDELSPVLPYPQTVRASRATARWTAGDQGALLLERSRAGGSLWVLTDPDLIANHGIDEGENARIALELIDRLRGDGTVFVDESVHGFVRRESVWTVLLEFPLVTLLIHAVLLAIAIACGAARRFGVPEPRPAPYAPGKVVLIDNGARLLAAGDTTWHAAARTFDGAVTRAKRVLRAPDGLGEAETLEWLGEAGRRRGAIRDPVRLKEELKQLRTRGERARPALVRWAAEVHDWREEIEHGP